MEKVFTLILTAAMILPLSACSSSASASAAVSSVSETETDWITLTETELDEKGKQMLESLYTDWTADPEYGGTEDMPMVTLSADGAFVGDDFYTICVTECYDEVMYIYLLPTDGDTCYELIVCTDFQDSMTVDQYNFMINAFEYSDGKTGKEKTDSELDFMVYITTAESAARQEAETSAENTSGSDLSDVKDNIVTCTEDFVEAVYVADPSASDEEWQAAMQSFSFEALMDISMLLDDLGTNSIPEEYVREGFEVGKQAIEEKYGTEMDIDRFSTNFVAYYNVWSDEDFWTKWGENADTFMSILAQCVVDLQ